MKLTGAHSSARRAEERGSRLGSKMSSWVQLLLLALLAACAQFGVAEEDPLPAALVELVRNSPINSIEDLQLLLLTDSVDEEEANSAANGGHRLPRSPDPEPAPSGHCKVRTEVLELTRDMVESARGNFQLFPPCVEVQRCSGCCTTSGIQCLSNSTSTRYLTVAKIVYRNSKPTFAKAVVSVVDHLDCKCQLRSRPAVLKKRASHRVHSHLHRNQILGPAPAQGQEDPLPAALVELVRNSPINSIEDLQLLPRTDSVDEEEANSAANGGHRLPRSPDPERAKRARCKVRSEVVDLIRYMVDRSNANFLLFPPCEEVQRCSGCCNTKDIQCVSNSTSTRNVTVTKIVFSKRPSFSKVVVSVVDHVDCICQTTPRPAVLKKRASHRLHSHLHRNHTLGPAPAQGQDGPAQEKASLI